MKSRVRALLVLAACGLGACAPQSGVTGRPGGAAAPRDFGDVTLEAFERHPNLREVPEGRVQDSMFACAMSWRSDHTTPEAEMLVNAAKAYDLMAEGNWKEIDPYCSLSAVKNYLP